MKVKTETWQKIVGYCTPVKNHNVGRKQAKDSRKEYVL